MKIPIICETPGCANEGTAINIVTVDDDEVAVDDFFENYRGEEPEDICPLCNESGVAADPEPDAAE